MPKTVGRIYKNGEEICIKQKEKEEQEPEYIVERVKDIIPGKEQILFLPTTEAIKLYRSIAKYYEED